MSSAMVAPMHVQEEMTRTRRFSLEGLKDMTKRGTSANNNSSSKKKKKKGKGGPQSTRKMSQTGELGMTKVCVCVCVYM